MKHIQVDSSNEGLVPVLIPKEEEEIKIDEDRVEVVKHSLHKLHELRLLTVRCRRK